MRSPRRALESLPGWATFVLVLAVGVTVSGGADFALSQAGYGNWGALVWATGYAGTVLVLWAGWLRHVDFAGATPPEVHGDDDAEPREGE